MTDGLYEGAGLVDGVLQEDREALIEDSLSLSIRRGLYG